MAEMPAIPHAGGSDRQLRQLVLQASEGIVFIALDQSVAKQADIRKRLSEEDVDRAVDAFEERVIEATETVEEVVIDKKARVVEAVTIGKTVDDRV